MHRRGPLLALVAALLLAGCGGGDDGDPEPSGKRQSDADRLLEDIDTSAPKVTGDHDVVKQVLKARAQALLKGDAAALRRTAGGRQLKTDRRTLRWLRQLPLDDVRIVPEGVDVVGARAEAAVRLRYTVRGAQKPYEVARAMVLRERGDQWRVVRDVALQDRLPWEVTGFRLTRGPHVALLTPPGVAPGRLLPGLVDAYREIERDLPARDLPRTVLVIAAADARQTRRLGGTKVGRGIVAFADVKFDADAAPAPGEDLPVIGQRMVVIVNRWGLLPEASRQRTLVHEMVHTAMFPGSAQRVPQWLEEGVAMFVAGELAEMRGVAAASGAPDHVPLARMTRARAMLRMDPITQAGAYATSVEAAHLIAERFGRRKLFALYDAFKDTSIRGGESARTVDRVLRRTLGISLSRLDRAVAAR